MPLKGATLNEGATPAFTGGSAVTYGSTASNGNGVLTAVTTVTDYRVRPSTLHTVKLPAYDPATGKYGKQKNSLVHKRPKLDTDGSIVFPLVRIDIETHPIQSAAEVQALWDWIAQIATDADYANFRATGSLD